MSEVKTEFLETSADFKVESLPLSHVSVEIGHLYMEDFSEGVEVVQRAFAAGIDARVDVWMGMPHGFPGRIGTLKASGEALEAIGVFLGEKLQSGI